MTRDEVIARLKRRLRNRRLQPQRRLAPERELAAAIGCSRSTLRSALDRLEREGLVWRHVGRGTFLGTRPRTEDIKPWVLFEQTSALDLLDARLVLEPAIAAAAARCASAEDRSTLQALAARSAGAASWQAYEALDAAFHRAVASASGSRLLLALLTTLSSVRTRTRWQRQHQAAFRTAHERAYSLRQGRMHARIATAIASGDAAAARDAMRAHLRSIRTLFIAAAVDLPALRPDLGEGFEPKDGA